MQKNIICFCFSLAQTLNMNMTTSMTMTMTTSMTMDIDGNGNGKVILPVFRWSIRAKTGLKQQKQRAKRKHNKI